MFKRLDALKKSRVVKNSGWIIGGKIAQMVISFFVGIFTARYLGPSNYGIINTAQAYASFVLPICSLGLTSTFVKEVLDHPDEDGKYLGSGILMRCISSIIAMIVMLFVVIGINPDNRTLHIVFFIHSFVLLFQSFDLFEYWYQSKLESKYASLFGTIGYLIAAAYKVFLLVTGKSVEWFAFSTVLDYAIVAILYLLNAKRKYKMHFTYSFATMKSMFNASKHFILASLMVMAYAQMDKIMIGRMMSDANVGLYSVATTICGLWTFILAAVINSLRPVIIETRKINYKKYQQRIIQLYSIVIWMSIGASALICIFGRFIILVLYGEQYVGSLNALRIVTWYTSFSYLGTARNVWTVCEGKQKYEKNFAFAGVVSNFIMNATMIPIMGIEGAALASLLTQIITNVVTPYLIKDCRENAIYAIKAFNPVNAINMLKQ